MIALDHLLLAIVGTLGLGTCAWNLREAYGDHAWAGRVGDKKLSMVAKGAMIRTVLYSMAQVVMLASAVLEPSDHGSLEWQEFVEVRGILMSALVVLMSVHDRIARLKITDS